MKLPKFQIKTELNPHTASQLGYELVGDVAVLWRKAYAIVPEDIQHFMKAGFKVGKPTSAFEAGEYVGLYRPVS